MFIAESAVAAVAGLALALFPSAAASAIFGSPLDGPVGTVVGQGTGVTLLTLAMVCWAWSKADETREVAGPIGVMLFYDTAVVVVLLSAHFAEGVFGIDLWPAVALHSGLAI